MEYFKIKEKDDFINDIGKKYDRNKDGAKWFYDSRKKLKYLGELLFNELGIEIVNNYREKPNGQAGQGKGFVLKDYVLQGFVPKEYQSIVGKSIFFKLQFTVSKEELWFSLDCDINFKDRKNKYHSKREKMIKQTSKKWLVDSKFPSTYKDLVELIKVPSENNLKTLKSYIEESKDNNKNSSAKNQNRMNYNKNQNVPLNQILFGPPGTGKTYSTADKVVEICLSDSFSTTNRKKNKEQYDKLVEQGKVFFTTFHQSLSYEDFIEGIKPIPPKNKTDQISYDVEDGIFKSICEQCLDEIREIAAEKDENLKDDLTFKEKYDEFVKQIQKGIINVQTRSGLDAYVSRISASGNMRLKTGEDTKDYIISSGRLEKLVNEIEYPDKVDSIHKTIREIIGGSHSSLYYAALKSFKGFEKKLQEKLKEEGKEVKLKDVQLSEQEILDLPKYVLIIDEINRGNVSAIFGELITLLEEDKRFGKDNQLYAQLPYSKSNFIVPPNLFIIGTMNTADRSVEALDTALRRRFSFTEMPPVYNIDEDMGTLMYSYAGFKGAEILEIINARIEKLLDRDHLIGHSYFLFKRDEENIEDKLIDAFYRNIIPLMQEYFYGDYAKIGAVLGSGFVTKNENDDVTFGDGFNDEDYGDKDVYQIIDYRRVNNPINPSNMTFEDAIRKLMNKPKEIKVE